jgi:hypothetical protein
MALQFFQNAAVGTPVEIRHASAPEYLLVLTVSAIGGNAYKWLCGSPFFQLRRQPRAATARAVG